MENQNNQELFEGKYRIKSSRATWWNYNEGLYFITICTADRKHFFGEIKDAAMIYTKIGEYTQQCICQMEQLHSTVIIPFFVVMPNHVHMIISIEPDDEYKDKPQNVETPYCDVSTKNTKMQEIANHCGTLAHLITQFKAAVTKYAKQNEIVFRWQSRFHDRIIRNQNELCKIADYIQNNVYKWNADCFNDTVETPQCDVSTNK